MKTCWNRMTSITVRPASKNKLISIFFSLFNHRARVYILRTWHNGACVGIDIQPNELPLPVLHRTVYKTHLKIYLAPCTLHWNW